ncbi:hypothetical protein PL321_17975 [Caloramator sp. mosi_1]|uniref:hypothetical protein n=1 Tax=Caloramator sp. mosi_1 TaxID=3023090 RepID=UPI002360B3F7|nr:hypothetical protein [Caloramator sp. mosi_1]WDC84129.1 hypothetical protein PL321_17975 [Caloramator sp. mosi_1]
MPLFLKHYYEVKEGTSTINLYYIDKANNQDNILCIYFPEIKYKPVILNENIVIESGNYKLKSIEINLCQGDTSDVIEQIKNTVITKIEVEYRNGEKN